MVFSLVFFFFLLLPRKALCYKKCKLCAFGAGLLPPFPTLMGEISALSSAHFTAQKTERERERGRTSNWHNCMLFPPLLHTKRGKGKGNEGEKVKFKTINYGERGHCSTYRGRRRRRRRWPSLFFFFFLSSRLYLPIGGGGATGRFKWEKMRGTTGSLCGPKNSKNQNGTLCAWKGGGRRKARNP